jgi:antitoxin ParD1/3/4
MELPLPPELQRFVDEKVKSGQFDSAAEVITTALELMKDQDEMTAEDIEELRAEVAIGIEQLDRGEGAEWDVEKVKARLLERVQKAKRAS